MRRQPQVSGICRQGASKRRTAIRSGHPQPSRRLRRSYPMPRALTCRHLLSHDAACQPNWLACFFKMTLISQTARTGTPVPGPHLPRTPVGQRAERAVRCNGRSAGSHRPQDRNPRRRSTQREPYSAAGRTRLCSAINNIIILRKQRRVDQSCSFLA